MTAPGMLIIGAGHVGGRAAQHLRAQGWDGPIVLVGEEPHAPYERPPLSKEVLTGERQPASCALRQAEDWDADRITHVRARVAALDPARHEATLADGQRIVFSKALLATGGTPRWLQVPGANLPGVMALRTIDDAVALAARLIPGASVAIVGGGFIGLEVAASARVRGCSVHVVESAPCLLGRVVPAPIARAVEKLHAANGVAIVLGRAPRAIEAQGGRLVLELDEGSRIAADTIVVGIGIEPAMQLARACALEVGRGVRVGPTLATSAADIFAAGDVAEFPSPLAGTLIRQETWHNAETQARTAALNMLGAREPYAALPWGWSDQYDHQLQVIGEPTLGPETIVRQAGDASIYFYRGADGRLVGAAGFGRTSDVAKDLKVARLLVERRTAPASAQLIDPATRLKSLLV